MHDYSDVTLTPSLVKFSVMVGNLIRGDTDENRQEAIS